MGTPLSAHALCVCITQPLTDKAAAADVDEKGRGLHQAQPAASNSRPPVVEQLVHVRLQVRPGGTACLSPMQLPKRLLPAELAPAPACSSSV